MKLFLFKCLASLLLYVWAIVSIFAKNSGNCFLIKPQMDTRIHRNTYSEPLTTFLRRTMRSRQDVLFNFVFLSKFGCHGNSLGFLEILGSIFEVADTENPTIHAKFVSIYCTEVKLCLFECLAYLYHCGYRQFSRFLRKTV